MKDSKGAEGVRGAGPEASVCSVGTPQGRQVDRSTETTPASIGLGRRLRVACTVDSASNASETVGHECRPTTSPHPTSRPCASRWTCAASPGFGGSRPTTRTTSGRGAVFFRRSGRPRGLGGRHRGARRRTSGGARDRRRARRRSSSGAARRRARVEAAGCSPIARTVAVVTGQQAGLFGGPVFTLLKALTALKLAEQVSREQGVPAVRDLLDRCRGSRLGRSPVVYGLRRSD